MNRGAPSGTNTGATNPPVSKKKKDAAEQHIYPALTVSPCDNLAYTRNMGIIQDILTKNRPSYEKCPILSSKLVQTGAKLGFRLGKVLVHCAVNFRC